MIDYSINIHWKAVTCGDGLYAHRNACVQLTEICVKWDEGSLTVEINVSFDTSTWENSRDGLIYTDSCFLYTVRRLIEKEMGVPEGCALEYSEEGMQGEDYVSFEASAGPFIEAGVITLPEDYYVNLNKY